MSYVRLMLGLWAASRAMWAATPQFGGENPIGGAPDPNNWHHEGITRAGAQSAGWSWPARNALAFHADYVDSYLYNPLWWVNVTDGGGLERVSVVWSSRHELVKLHFDDLFAPEQVHATWQRYLSGTVAGLLWITTLDQSDRVKVSLAHNVVGASLHAVQDFYSHSNWIDDPSRRKTTWHDVPAATRERLSVWTGSYEEDDHRGIKPHGEFLYACTVINNLGRTGKGLVRMLCSSWSPLSKSFVCDAYSACEEAEAIDVPEAWKDNVPGFLRDQLVWVKPGIAVDSKWLAPLGVEQRGLSESLTGDEAFEVAYALAARSSCQWLCALEHIMNEAGHAEFWGQVTTVGTDREHYTADIHPWEDMALIPYRFLTAGPYPPDPRGKPDTEQWYLRLHIDTADVHRAGTNADIVAAVDGVNAGVLDHAPPPDVPSDGEPPRITTFDSALSHNDFEKGESAAYILGPFENEPRRVVLSNRAPDAGDVLMAMLDALADAIVGFFEGLGDFFRSLVGYHADYIDTDHLAFDAATLAALPVRGRLDFTLHCHHHSEGKHDVNGYVYKTEVTGSWDNGVAWREYEVTVSDFVCIQEADSDRWSNSDEPFFLGLVIPHGGSAEPISWRTGWYEDIDTGEGGVVNKRSWVRVPESFGMVSIAVAAWEHDGESARDRDQLLREFAEGANGRTRRPEQDLLVTLSEAVASGWRPARVKAVAFRRGEDVEVVDYEALLPETWVMGGDHLRYDLTAQSRQRVSTAFKADRRCPGGLPSIDFDLVDPDVLDGLAVPVPIPRPRFTTNLEDLLTSVEKPAEQPVPGPAVVRDRVGGGDVVDDVGSVLTPPVRVDPSVPMFDDRWLELLRSRPARFPPVRPGPRLPQPGP